MTDIQDQFCLFLSNLLLLLEKVVDGGTKELRRRLAPLDSRSRVQNSGARRSPLLLLVLELLLGLGL